jgi:hypothetical protein
MGSKTARYEDDGLGLAHANAAVHIVVFIAEHNEFGEAGGLLNARGGRGGGGLGLGLLGRREGVHEGACRRGACLHHIVRHTIEIRTRPLRGW